MKNKRYIVTSIPYANAKPHLGHTLDVLYGDVLARYFRSRGQDVLLQAGTDENGQKLYYKAMEMGVPTKKWIEGLRPVFKDFFKQLNISYDLYTQTSEAAHHLAAQEVWRRAEQKGDIYKKKYTGLYCVGCESFKTEADLEDGKCPDHQTVPEKVEEENYFFRLSNYQSFLEGHFKDNPKFVAPENALNESLGMLKGGLEDVSISRPKSRLPWGVPVPGDDGHVMYVWFDALTNYLTALGFPEDEKTFNEYWPIDIEIVGKDNNRWHTLLWPAMLESAGLALPHTILVHGHILAKGGMKMSKTIGNVIDPIEMISRFGSDPFRYYLLTRIPMTGDGSFDLEQFEKVYETELGNELGNLVQRTISMINRYEVPVVYEDKAVCTGDSCVGKYVEEFNFAGALDKLWGCVRANNKVIEDEKPWQLAKENPEKMVRVLGQVYNFLCIFSTQISYFMPETAERLKSQLRDLRPEPLFPRRED